jgi:hypothetical protein
VSLVTSPAIFEINNIKTRSNGRRAVIFAPCSIWLASGLEQMVENLALRQQLAVLKRKHRPPRKQDHCCRDHTESVLMHVRSSQAATLQAP